MTKSPSTIPMEAEHVADGGKTRFEFPPDYWKELANTCNKEDSDKAEPVLGQLGRLQRLNIAHLFNTLVSIKADIKCNESTTQDQMSLLRDVMHQYAEAIRDYKLLTELPFLSPKVAADQRMSLEKVFEKFVNPVRDSKSSSVPYHTIYMGIRPRSSQKPDVIREFFRLKLPNFLSWSDEEKASRVEIDEGYTNGLSPEVYSPFVNSVASFLIGTVAGASLIVPMVVMVFSPSLTKSLVTSSVAVVLFSLGMGLVLDAPNDVIVTATATYAAVLVVFVGTTLESK